MVAIAHDRRAGVITFNKARISVCLPPWPLRGLSAVETDLERTRSRAVDHVRVVRGARVFLTAEQRSVQRQNSRDSGFDRERADTPRKDLVHAAVDLYPVADDLDRRGSFPIRPIDGRALQVAAEADPRIAEYDFAALNQQRSDFVLHGPRSLRKCRLRPRRGVAKENRCDEVNVTFNGVLEKGVRHPIGAPAMNDVFALDHSRRGLPGRR